MQAFENITKGREKTPTKTLVTCFKPRQLLLNSKPNSSNMAKASTFSLSDQQRLLLFQSISHFFQNNGFSKSLKKFTKEAHLEKESWKNCELNLEEMCYHFLKKRNDTKVGESEIKKQVISQMDKVNHVQPVETIGKTKKNKDDEAKIEDTPIDDVKPEKKKKKSASQSFEQIAEENNTKPSNEVGDNSLSLPNEPEKKTKDKKKKEETSDVSQDKKKDKFKSKKKKEDDLKIEDSPIEDTEVDNGKKGSKKRKKSSTEETENGDVEKQLLGDSKRRKKDALDQSKETIAPKTPNGFSNGILENDEKESQKEKSKQRNGSTEPKSAANAFRRVKEEEVEFVDERLQDNSYWAKDGAESGYGAKAQEVLGQVRGRGFRHEKTKKKRGSYRGGQIDLDSHSFKFNYDDDDE